MSPEDYSSLSLKPKSTINEKSIKTAIIYCEGNFGNLDGKTANGLVRHSEKYKILSVIDSEKSGLDSGIILDNKANGIPVFSSLKEAVSQTESLPDYFIIGVAPANGALSDTERLIVLEAINLGMNIVNGLHEFLSADVEFTAASKLKNVTLLDIRKPRPLKDLRLYTDKIHKVDCIRIAILGTDCAVGKRTTATILTKALNHTGIKTVMVGTGQTCLIQGARYGVALDAIPSQFACGELEATIIEAYENEKPDVIVIEGQSALSHPAFNSSAAILKGSLPHAVILQHAPKREFRCDFEMLKVPLPQFEINLIETFINTKVIGLTINHENMSDIKVTRTIKNYEDELNILVTDALSRPIKQLTEMVFKAFPELQLKQKICTE